jgi:hypothetical protein
MGVNWISLLREYGSQATREALTLIRAKRINANEENFEMEAMAA